MPNNDYIRSHYVEKLNNYFQDRTTPCILISGVGGAGKSSLATGYAYNDYLENIIWNDWRQETPNKNPSKIKL